jgi:sterol desaturase/sphingolipid hydroxylase (fatty acid hydroxylase superfamily)
MTRIYETTSGVVFAVVALAHAVRAANGWTLQVDVWSVPVWMSWIAAVVAAGLSVWAFRRARARRP